MVNYEDSIEVKTFYFDKNGEIMVQIPNDSNQVCTWELIKDSLRICNQWYLTVFKNDSLIISQGYVDGLTEYFLKQKI